MVERALTHTRAAVGELDTALGGERTAGGSGSRRRPRIAARRYIGALGPRMRAFTREHADGLILNFAPRSALAGEAAGEPGDVVLPVRIGEGTSRDAERRFRREAASYLRVPAYASGRSPRWDRPDVVRPRASCSRWPTRSRRPSSQDMGVLADAAAMLARMERDGVSPLLVPVVAPGDLADFERIMRAAVSG